MNQTPRVFRAVIDGCARWPVNLVVTTGPGFDPALLGPLPPAVRSAPFEERVRQLGLDPGLVKDGVEKHLQALLAERCHAIRPDLSLVRREYPTDIGPVDLLCRDQEGGYVAVEVKRRGEIDGVEQLSRYLARLQPGLDRVRGMLVALEFRPQARVLAGERGIDCVQVDYDTLKGIESDTLTLF